MEAKVNLVDLGSISHGLNKGNFIKLVCKWHILPNYIPPILSILLAKKTNSFFECSFKFVFT